MGIQSNTFLQRRAIAIFTLLAMLVAPLCGSLCGSRVCASLASTPSDDCHSSLPANDNGSRTGLAAIRVCGLQELPAAALNEPTNSPDTGKKVSAVHAPSNLAPSESIQLLVSDACSSHPNNKRCIATTSVQPTILRI